LILLIRGMGRELFNFAAVYFMVSLGFGIGFFGLFSYADSYNTYGYTYVTLIQNTLGDFDIDAFHSENLITNALGIVLIICFVIMMNVVLMNVLIAQMTRYVLIMLMLLLMLLLDDDLILLSLSYYNQQFVRRNQRAIRSAMVLLLCHVIGRLYPLDEQSKWCVYCGCSFQPRHYGDLDLGTCVLQCRGMWRIRRKTIVNDEYLHECLL